MSPPPIALNSTLLISILADNSYLPSIGYSDVPKSSENATNSLAVPIFTVTAPLPARGVTLAVAGLTASPL